MWVKVVEFGKGRYGVSIKHGRCGMWVDVINSSLSVQYIFD